MPGYFLAETIVCRVTGQRAKYKWKELVRAKKIMGIKIIFGLPQAGPVVWWPGGGGGGGGWGGGGGGGGGGGHKNSGYPAQPHPITVNRELKIW
jgi:hypothetical protein